MSRSYLVLSAIALFAAQNAVAADNDSTQITINGNAEEVCGFIAQPVLAATGAQQNTTPTSLDAGHSTVVIDDLVDEENGITVNNASITLEYEGLCNHPHYLSVKTLKGGLKDDSAPAPLTSDFINRIDYQILAEWPTPGSTFSAGFTTDGDSAQKSISGEVPGASVGTLRVSLNIANSMGENDAGPVAAGTYSDTVIVQLGAGL